MDRIYVMELVRSYQCGFISRRTFLARSALAMGSLTAASTLLAACAQGPASPTPVVEPATSPTAATGAAAGEGERSMAGGPPDPNEIRAETVSYPGEGDQTLTGYMARPGGEEPRPAVIVIQEWWGLNDHIKDVINRFSTAGYVALGPDLYHGVVATEPNEARKMVMELDMNAAVVEIQRAIDYLQAQPFVKGPKVGIVGFCMGGRLVLQTARVEPDIGAAIPFYGSPLTPEEASTIKAPVLGIYGEQDSGIPVAEVRRMIEAIQANGVEAELQVYEGAPHAFFNDTRAESFRPEAAGDAWARTLAWLERHLA